MVIGNGLIGGVFSDFILDDRYLIFASGVSNSNEDRDSEFDREFKLLKEHIITDKKFIYFSTVNHKDNKYFNHKRKIEKFICENSNDYLIYKLPNVVGDGGNPKNIFNYFKSSILNGDTLTILDVYRSIIDIEDVYKICKYCISEKNKILNISYIEKTKVDDLVKIISDILGKTVQKNKIGSPNDELLDNSFEIEQAIKEIGIKREGYTKLVIKKYLRKW